MAHAFKKIDSAVIETNPDALTIADQLDQERAQGKVRKTFLYSSMCTAQ